MFYETAGDAHGLAADPFLALVAPRPIGWISTLHPDGTPNLAPYSWFNAVADEPKLVMFASGGAKHSAENAIRTGEFVANLATEALAEAVNLSSAALDAARSEFVFAGVSPAPCRLVAAPRVAESPVALECRVTETLVPRGANGAASGSLLVFGEVVGIHIDESVLVDGRVNMGLLRPLARLGYRDYAAVVDVFRMTRPRLPEQG